ncbi:hypothetical protein ACWGJ9_09785 [Curtobacterium citreum]
MAQDHAAESAAADIAVREAVNDDHAFISNADKFMLAASEFTSTWGSDQGTRVLFESFEWGAHEAEVALGMADIVALHQFLGGVIGRANGVPASDTTALGELHSIIAGIEDPKLHDQLVAVHNRFRAEAGQ